MAPDAPITLQVRDNCSGVDLDFVWMEVQGRPVGLRLVPDSLGVTVSFSPPGGWADGDTVDLELRACDDARNCGTHAYWFVVAQDVSLVQLSLVPEQATLTPGGTARVLVELEDPGRQVCGGDVTLAYDGSLLRAGQVQPGDALRGQGVNLSSFVNLPDSAAMAGDTTSLPVLLWSSSDPPSREAANVRAIAAAFCPSAVLTLTTTRIPDDLERLLADKRVLLLPEPSGSPTAFAEFGAACGFVLRGYANSGGCIALCGLASPYLEFCRSAGLVEVVGSRSAAYGVVKAPEHPLAQGLPGILPPADATVAYAIRSPDYVTIVESPGSGPIVAERVAGQGRVLLIGYDYWAYDRLRAQLLANALRIGQPEPLVARLFLTGTQELARGTGALCSVQFSAVPAASPGAGAVVSLRQATLYTLSGAPVPVVRQGCRLTVTELKGDVDASGRVDLQDALLVTQFVAGQVVLTPVQLRAADMNGDGTVDMSDLAELLGQAAADDASTAAGKWASGAPAIPWRPPVSSELRMTRVERCGEQTLRLDLAAGLGPSVVGGMVSLALDSGQGRVAKIEAVEPAAWSWAADVGEPRLAAISFARRPECSYVDSLHLRVTVDVGPRAAEASPEWHRWTIHRQGTHLATSTAAGQVTARLWAADGLLECYPNPCNATTVLRFCLGAPGDARLRIFSVTGQLVRSLQPGRLPAGVHAVAWDGCDEQGRPVGSGVYLCRLETEASPRPGVRRLVLLR
ncbi:MAG: dockerin type I domain-containing protein [Candidatus Latescibacterota bacterium]